MSASVAAGVVAMIVALLFAAPVAVAVYAARLPSYSCAVEELPTLQLELDPAYEVEGRLSSWPLGLECAFTTASGETVVVGPGWLLSGLAVVSRVFTTTALGAAVNAFLPRRRR